MSRFTLTSKATCDLKEIGRYTQYHWGYDQRNRYLALLDASFKLLATHPLKGKDCSDFRQGYRKFNVGSHVIFYHLKSADTIEIIRILHGRMDVAAEMTR